MSSIREQLVAAAVTALNTNRPGDVPAFVRTRVEELTAAQLPANDVYPLDAKTSPGPGGFASPLVKRALVLRLRMSAGPGVGTTGDQETDRSYVWALKTLSGNTLGGLAHATNEVDPPEGEAFGYRMVDDVPVCEAVVDFEIRYQTKTSDPSSTGAA